MREYTGCRFYDSWSILLLCSVIGVGAVVSAHADCTQLPCLNGGLCGFEPGTNVSLSCLCPPSHCGDRCQFLSPCQNGGKCVYIVTGPEVVRLACECPVNYTGYRCEHLHACSSNPCPTNRRCEVDIFNSYRCECLEAGYHGPDCDIFNKCSQSPCRNNGTCAFTGSNRYRCDCNPNGIVSGFHGVNCELFNPCLTSPCGEAGTCHQDPSKGASEAFNCSCDDQHYGELCQYRDECLQSPCLNNGWCSLLETGGFECDCPAGYLGPTCAHSVCNWFSCRHNGTCSIDELGRPVCLCPSEYYGSKCQTLNSCLQYELCQHGGNCTDVQGDYFTCACPVGWIGILCAFKDPCVDNTCHPNQTCISATPYMSYQCTCNSAEYNGPWCTDYDSCSHQPCQNGGYCTFKGHMSYDCDCAPNGFPTGYYGKNCEHRQPCPEQLPSVCSNHGVCEYTNKEPGYKCVQCDSGYYGQACERYDGCHSDPCKNGQPCVSLYLFQKYFCNCSEQYTGDHCEIPVTCNDPSSSITVSTKGLYFWPETLIGKAAVLPCHVGTGFARRRCEAWVTGGFALAIFWVTPDMSSCDTVNFTKEVATNMSHYLVHTTSNAEDMQEEEVTSSTELLVAIIIYAYYDYELAKDLMLCISNLLEVNETVLRDSSVQSDTNTKLLSMIDSYAEKTVLGTNDSAAELLTDNIEIKVEDVSLEQATMTGSHFQSSLPNSQGISVNIPSEAFAEEDLMAAVGETDSVRVNFVVMTNTKLFIPVAQQEEAYNGYAVSARIQGRAVSGLAEPVTISLPMENVEVGKTPKCAFWNGKEGRWDTTGLKLISKANNSAVCESSHLTYFGIIVDPGMPFEIPATHMKILSIITRVGLCVTLCGLLLTFLTYLLFKQLRGTRSGKILIHLSASLFGLNFVFIIDSALSLKSPKALCLASAILLHYFVLTSFSWMAMEAVNMYRALVQVFIRGSTGCFMTKCIITSWVVPIAIVTAAAATGPEKNYGERQGMCLLLTTNPYVYYISYLGPCCIILAINIVVFVMVLYAVCSPRSKKLHNATSSLPRNGVRKTQIGCALSVTFLLGLTWVFGLFAVGNATLVFQYICTTLNTMQGFFIFLFRCALNPEAVRCWRHLITNGTLNPRQTPCNSAIKNNNQHSQHSQQTNSTKLQHQEQQSSKAVVSVVNTGYVSDELSSDDHILRILERACHSSKYSVDSYEKWINTWEQNMKLRNVMMDNIKPRNDI
ncbi:cadherin EGF LAG seven-pass G-type receptor 2-like [Acanthaster planci]|uniref:Cadherin EGF LAG seven-pass G-type receptor 2-like n=1 Tax=Acanthaster planci TaxID=133434 RepID=A0A8B7ZU21_ACAPL|nr:cadherin EGF LAG seven-pass G-type receptor 2-like [Acanthaster planci]